MAKKKKARAGSADGGTSPALPETRGLGASSGTKKKKRTSDSAAAAVGASNWSALATKIGAGTNPKAKKRRAERLAAEEAARAGGAARFGRDGSDVHRLGHLSDGVHRDIEKTFLKKPAPVGRNTALTDVIALDCEMVGCGEDGKRSVLARVSVVNEDGNVVLDTFVAPGERVVDYRTRVSGVRPSDLAHAPPFREVQKKMADILKGRVLIGHALRNDLKCLLLDHPKSMTRDTATYRPLTRPLRANERRHDKGVARGRGARSLRELCAQHLGLEIQAGEHSSVDDARAALLLYRKCAVAWERELRTAGAGDRRKGGGGDGKKKSASREETKKKRRERDDDDDDDDDDERERSTARFPKRDRADPFGVGDARVDLFRR